MTGEAKQREIVPEDWSPRETILTMLLEELLNWLRTAEEAEAKLAVLAHEPKGAEAREAFDEAVQALVWYPTDWIALHAQERASEADLPGRMKEIRKLFQQVDFLMMPDTTVPEEQSMSGVKARLRVQVDKVSAALDGFVNTARDMLNQRP